MRAYLTKQQIVSLSKVAEKKSSGQRYRFDAIRIRQQGAAGMACVTDGKVLVEIPLSVPPHLDSEPEDGEVAIAIGDLLPAAKVMGNGPYDCLTVSHEPGHETATLRTDVTVSTAEAVPLDRLPDPRIVTEQAPKASPRFGLSVKALDELLQAAKALTGPVRGWEVDGPWIEFREAGKYGMFRCSVWADGLHTRYAMLYIMPIESTPALWEKSDAYDDREGV